MKSSRSRFGADGLLPSFGVRICSLAGKVCDLKLSLYVAGLVRFRPQNIVCPKFAKVSPPFRGNFTKKRVNVVISAP
jgi:hypothetical protein